GTLRALGESGQDIVRQFVLESLLLSLGGVIAGTIGAAIFIQILESAKVVTEIPGATIPILIRVHFLFSAVGYAGLLAFVTTLIATLIPARNVAHMNIVDALRKNI
ncbi:MAG: FtsX-like permease family protein, partial [Bdellovibrionales bacterium]|nr:FtsX-like permease family protein [Bdellovibrionales bacterium]